MSNFAIKPLQSSILNGTTNAINTEKTTTTKLDTYTPPGSNDPKSICKEVGIELLDKSFLATQQSGGLNKDLIGLKDLAVKRLSAVGQQNLGVVNNGVFAAIGKAIDAFKKISDIISGRVKLKSDTASKVKNENEGYDKHLKEAGKLLTEVVGQIATPLANGNSITKSSGATCFIQQYLCTRSDAATTIDAPLIDIVGDVTVINSARIVTVNTNIWQGNHYYFHLNVEHGIQLSCKTANRYNGLSLRETSGEAEYIAGTMINYADVMWNQAGQASRVPLSSAQPDLATSYGSLVNYAQDNIIQFAMLGDILQSATRTIGLNARQICLNCSWTLPLSKVTPKVYQGITDATQAVSQQSDPNKKGGSAIEIDEKRFVVIPIDEKINSINSSDLSN